MADDPLDHRCQRIAQTVLATRRWKLVKPSDPGFIQVVRLRLTQRFPNRLNGPEHLLDDAIARCVKNEYSLRLYQAFKQNGSEAQALAMTEVKEFVFRSLVRMTEGNISLSDECAQQAISKAWEKLDRANRPESFLYFVLRFGIHEVLTQVRTDNRWAELPEDEPDKQDASNLIATDIEIAQSVEVTSARERLAKIIRHCSLSPEETRILTEIYLEGRTFAHLIKTWERSGSALYSLKHRALKRLNNCKYFTDLRRDWQGGDQ